MKNLTSSTLQNNTFSRLFVGQNLLTLAKVDSTNSYLKRELSKSTPLSEGTVILAEEQYAGRGQMNNAWVSEPGKNLTFSLLLTPSFTPDKQFLLNKAVSLAINDVFCKIIGNQVKIKWPNDIYYNHLKLGGVLIENIVQGQTWKFAIIGIGLNINQQAFPESLNNVTSLFKILQHDYSLNVLLKDICEAIEVRYLQFRQKDFEGINRDYLERLYLLGQLHKFRIDGSEVEGKIAGVNEQGLLLVKIQQKERSFDLKEIAYY